MSAAPLAVPQILIVEFGGQLTLKIESTLREAGFRSAILPPQRAIDWMRQFPVRGIILSGGLASVYDEDAPKIPAEVFALGVPVLGICYGMQAIAHYFGARVEKATPNYGKAVIDTVTTLLFANTSSMQTVWASHGDSVIQLPQGFSTTAVYLETGGIAGFMDADHDVFGVQFHPEATESEQGATILRNFAESICGCKRDWSPTSLIEEIGERTLELVGSHEKAVIGFSGGVDSTTVTSLLARVLGKRLHALTIDGGQLREAEMSEIRLHARATGVFDHIALDATDRFLAALEGVSDAETKRKQRFQPLYASIFQEVAHGLGDTVKYMVQGTLAPDRIESGATGGAVIKSHHNVGLNTGYLQQIHPIDSLFKYEVRALGRALGLPESVTERHPFPGPGLFIRHIGSITGSGMEIARWIDARSTEVIKHHGLFRQVSQPVFAYFAQPLVGVKGDRRVYCGYAGIRAVKTIDFMTAEGVAFEPEVQKELCRVLGRHPAIAHTAFFPTDKPPATTEFE